jgi:Tfp pilus assembly protein PilZ
MSQGERLLLVVENEAASDRYISALGERDLQCDRCGHIEEAWERLKQAPYSGVLLDMPTLVRASSRERNMIRDLDEYFPVLRMQVDPGSGKVRCLHRSLPSPGNVSIHDFLAKVASRFPGRTLRFHQRNELVRNLLFSDLGGELDPDTAEKAMACNLSLGGLFMCSTTCLDVDETASVVIMESGDHTPIPVKVRWNVAWPTPGRFPGMGMAFLDLTPTQSEEIRTWVEQSRDDPHQAA